MFVRIVGLRNLNTCCTSAIWRFGYTTKRRVRASGSGSSGGGRTHATSTGRGCGTCWWFGGCARYTSGGFARTTTGLASNGAFSSGFSSRRIARSLRNVPVRRGRASGTACRGYFSGSNTTYANYGLSDYVLSVGLLRRGDKSPTDGYVGLG